MTTIAVDTAKLLRLHGSVAGRVAFCPQCPHGAKRREL